MEFLFCWPFFCAGGVGAGPGKPPAMRTATVGHFLAYQPRMALTFRARRKHAKRGHRGLHNEKSRPCPALCGGRLRWVMWRSPVALRRHSDLPRRAQGPCTHTIRPTPDGHHGRALPLFELGMHQARPLARPKKQTIRIAIASGVG